MKTSEIKQNDWVTYNGSPSQIAYVGDGYVYLTNEEYRVPVSDLRPVFLTEEILEKNEWTYTPDCYCLLWNQLHRVETTDIWNLSRMGVSLGFIKYVHELQHIMWALGFGGDLKL